MPYGMSWDEFKPDGYSGGDWHDKPRLPKRPVPATYDGLVGYMLEHDAQFRSDAYWAVTPRASMHLRGVKDGNGRFVWDDAMSFDDKPRLFGHQVHILPGPSHESTRIAFVWFGGNSLEWRDLTTQ